MALIQTATPQQTAGILAAQAAEKVGQEQVEALDSTALASGLAGTIRQAFEESVHAKNNEVTLRLLTCQELRRGVYSAKDLAEIQQQGGSEIFINLTNVKCRAAESWIKDVMFTNGDKAWTLDPTEIPTLPASLEAAAAKIVAQEQKQLQDQGQEVHADTFDERVDELKGEILKRLRDIAKERVSNMETKIEDDMEEGGWDKALSQFINDFTTYPVAILKGPVMKKRRRLNWDDSGKPVISDTLVKEFSRVSPFDIYPAPDAVEINDGPLIQRHRMFRKDLEDMKGTPGYKDSEIDDAIAAYGKKGLVVTRAFDAQRDNLEGRPTSGALGRSTIEALQYWGSVQGSELKNWAGGQAEAMGIDKLEDNKSYEVEAWLVGSFVIKAVLNPDPFGLRPYFKASWDDVPGAWWGVAVAEIMADLQRMINACARALANNMALASGPQVEVNVDRLPNGVTAVESIYPWKIWQTKADKTGTGQKAISFYQPPSNAKELQPIMDWYYKKADEVTGIPNYTYGSAQVGGAGRTASGLSMLMDNASKGIKQAIANIDNAVSALVFRMYLHNLAETDDPSIKGDCRVVAKGTLGLIAREAIQSRRNEFLQATSNPFDMKILGPEGRAALLRELAKGLQMDVDKIVPTPEKLKAMQASSNMPSAPTPPDGNTLITAAASIVAAEIKAGNEPPELADIIQRIEGSAAGLVSPPGPAGGPPPGPPGAPPPGAPPPQQ